MKVTSAEFVKSAFSQGDLPTTGLPEVAFLGRSNVGKSSLLNTLLGRKALARTSNTPGRTQSINYFLVNGSIYFVDLPGYGFAKVSKTMRASWGKMAEAYLSDRRELVLCVQLVDLRHEPTALDMQLHEWLSEREQPHIVVGTKADKLSANQIQKQANLLRRTVSPSEVIVFSSVSGRGKDEVWEAVGTAVKKTWKSS